MRKKATIIALLCVITGCKFNQPCDAYTQCDELYINDYNCTVTRNISHTPRYPTPYLQPTMFYRYPVANHTVNHNYYYNKPQDNTVVSPRPTIWHQTTQRKPQNTRKPKATSRDGFRLFLYLLAKLTLVLYIRNENGKCYKVASGLL